MMVVTSTYNLCFRAEIRKIKYTPINPSFTMYKWGPRGSKLDRHDFVMLWHSSRNPAYIILTPLNPIFVQ